MPSVDAESDRPLAVVHVDLDGARDIFGSHGWTYLRRDDPIFLTGMRNALEFFARNDVKATLFTIADSLDEIAHFQLLREASAQGHEIASHTLSHALLTRVDSSRKRREISESRKKLEELLSVPVRGFRAPGYLLDAECIDLLGECGYRYDSSAFPTRKHSERLGVPISSLRSPQRPYPDNKLIELPLPGHRPSPFPFNPSYSLLFGTSYFRWGLERHARTNVPLILLFHLIDLADPLPKEDLPGPGSRVFTLSTMSSARKMTKCQQMLDCVREKYVLTTTSELLATVDRAS